MRRDVDRLKRPQEPADQRQQHDAADCRQHNQPTTGVCGIAAHAHESPFDGAENGIGDRPQPASESTEGRDTAGAHEPGARAASAASATTPKTTYRTTANAFNCYEP